MTTADCIAGNDFDGRLPVRISSIFVILVGSLLGAWFPVFAARHKGTKVPAWAFFIAKHFGSGVIVGTAFIHLLVPAQEALSNPCLTGPITEYPWTEGICLMAIFALFFVEVITTRYTKVGHGHEETSDDAHTSSSQEENAAIELKDLESGDVHSLSASEPFAAQLTSMFILEFGVVFHSVFVGLTLALAGSEFRMLYIVLSFHQTFEGLALGSRLASLQWPQSKRWTPYLLAIGFAITSPLAIAIGLAVRSSYDPGSASALIANGVFDSISAGILIYTGLVELMAHDFIFSSHMQQAPIREVLGAFGMMCCGAGMMAVLGKWA